MFAPARPPMAVALAFTLTTLLDFLYEYLAEPFFFTSTTGDALTRPLFFSVTLLNGLAES